MALDARAVAHDQALFRGGDADHRERARSRAHSAANSSTRAGWHAQHVAFLRFVAPQLHRRQRRIVAGHLVQVDHPAHAGVVQQFRDRVGQAAGTDVVDRAGSGCPSASATQRSITSWQRRSISGLSRCTEAKSRSSLRCRRCHRTGGAAAQADQHRRATEHDHRIAGRQRTLVDLVRSIAPRPPASMIGLS